MTASLQEAPPLAPTWALNDVLQVIGRLPEADLRRFLKDTFSAETLVEFDQPALVELSIGLLQQWQAAAVTPEAFLIQATASICRASFEAFVRLFWDEVPGSQPLLWNWHITVFCTELSQVAFEVFAGRPRPHDLVCNVAPGSSKSSVWSVLFPCWVWTNMPAARIITASHTDSLVSDLASMSRETMRGTMYQLCFPEVVFTETQDAKGHYRNTAGGERFTCTIGGKSPIGKHAHFIIIDDPIDPKKVLSEAERKVAAGFFTSVIPTRRIRGALGDVCVTMLVMQRLATDDPTSVMLEISKRKGAHPLKHICIPAEITDAVSPPELRQYYTGFNHDGACEADGLMDPVRYSRVALDEQRAILFEWGYAGQFLQSPYPLEGGLFREEWFNHRVKAAPFRARRIRYWDRASSSEDGTCFTAGVLLAYDGQAFYVEDVVRGRWRPDQRNEIMLATAMRDRLRYGKYEPVIYVEAEGGSSGRDAWLGIARKLVGFHVREDVVKGSKDTRAEPWAAQLAALNVYLVDNGELESKGATRASWNVNAYIQEHRAFRVEVGKKLGRYKDQVDASTGAFNLLIGIKRAYLPLRTYQLKQTSRGVGQWIVACSAEELESLEVAEQRVLMVTFTDPDPPVAKTPIIIDNAAGAGGCSSSLPKPDAALGGMTAVIPEDSRHPLPPALCKVLGMLTVKAADVDPADYQVEYGKPVAPWGLPLAALQFALDSAKKIWSLVLKKYDSPWQVLLLVDQGGTDRRALSAAMAIADTLHIPRTAIFSPSYDNKEELLADEPGNLWVFEQLKAARCHIVG